MAGEEGNNCHTGDETRSVQALWATMTDLEQQINAKINAITDEFRQALTLLGYVASGGRRVRRA